MSYGDDLLRDGMLTSAADRVPDIFVLFLLSRPAMFRRRDARDGVALLDIDAADRLLCKGSMERVSCIADLPAVS